MIAPAAAIAWGRLEQPKPSRDFTLKMLAEGEARILRQESVMVVGQRMLKPCELVRLRSLIRSFGGGDARQFVEEGARVGDLHEPELARAEIGIGETEDSIVKEDRAEIVGALRFQEVEIAHCPGADDLRDIARHDLALLRFTRLVADRDPPAGGDQLGDITLRRMIRHAAHRDFVTLGQGEVEQTGGDLRVLEEELVEVTEPKEQQGISRHAGAQPLILLHHRSESVSHDGSIKSEEGKCQLRILPGEEKARHLVSKMPGVSSGNVLLSHNL